jgi:dipeptidyl aminopeptidase/acylaminoacyl peptidase
LKGDRQKRRAFAAPFAFVWSQFMRDLRLPLFLIAIGFLTIGGCRKASPTGPPSAASGSPAGGSGMAAPKPVTFPELGAGKLIQPGIRFQELSFARNGVPMRLWIYQPEKQSGKLPLVLVPPAGSTLLAGMHLADGDRPEHYPYAKAGFLVVGFDIDGPVPDNSSEAIMKQGAMQFRDAQAGVANAKTALDFALAKIPNVDPKRVFIAGHSSAATLALLAAEHEPRIKACVAYAGVTDVLGRFGPQTVNAFNSVIPGYRDFLRFSSPDTQTEQLKCPVFLFAALDDGTFPPSESTVFAGKLKQSNPNVTCVTVAHGGHYDSMIKEGIPRGIRWLQKLP